MQQSQTSATSLQIIYISNLSLELRYDISFFIEYKNIFNSIHQRTCCDLYLCNRKTNKNGESKSELKMISFSTKKKRSHVFLDKNLHCQEKYKYKDLSEGNTSPRRVLRICKYFINHFYQLSSVDR